MNLFSNDLKVCYKMKFCLLEYVSERKALPRSMVLLYLKFKDIRNE